MKNRIKFLPILVLSLLAPAALAQTQTPVLTSSITELDVSDGTLYPFAFIDTGGSNYAIAPVVTLQYGGGGPNFSAATIDPASITISGGSVTAISLLSVGSGYVGEPTVTISGGSAPSPANAASGAAAHFQLNFPLATRFSFPSPGAANPNEAFGDAGLTIAVSALAQGTFPAAGFKYTFTVNGQSIGVTSISYPPGTPGTVDWTPPLPGVYYITASTTDGANQTTTLPIRYFATGTAITGPVQGGTLVPIGSSLVISATSTPARGFIQRIDFYTDWTGSTSGSTLIGSSQTYPYSVIYTPVGASGATHLIKAVAYDNNGNVVPEPLTYLDSETISMANPILALPTCTLTTPANQSSIPIPDYTSDASAFIPISVSANARPGGTISQVQLYIDGVLFGTQSVFPYTFKWSPTVVGLYYLTALAYDDKDNVIASTSSAIPTQSPAPTVVSIGALPSVAITFPNGGGTVTGGSLTQVTASATANSLDPKTSIPATIQSVQFFQDGNFIGSVTPPTPPAVDTGVYTITYKPVQKLDPTTQSALPSVLTAIATDTNGFASTSPGVTINVTAGGGGGGVIVGIPPTVSLTAPSDKANVVVNTPVTLSATATAPNGNIASISFLVDSKILGSPIAQYPYSTTWTPANIGFYTLSAEVIDNLGDKHDSDKITVYVVPEPAPTINIVTPSTGGTVTAGTAINLSASAASPTGTIASVQYFANGISIGTASAPPYTVSWTPTSSGVYTITSTATDNSGETSTSTPTIVEVIEATSGLGTVSYFGQYQGLTDGGRFAFIVVDGAFGTFIGHSSSTSVPVITFASDIPVSAAGSFGAPKMTGTASASGVSGTLSPSQDLFIGAATQAVGVKIAAGYYTGNISGQPGSAVTGILGSDGSLMVYVSSGSYTDVADGSVDLGGAFTITTVQNNTLVGKIDPTKGFLTATLSGASGGAVFGAKASGGTFSDGVLTNISTRGLASSGANAMIVGFVVGGSAPKQLLIRAAGPTLTTFGLSGAITSTQLQVFSGTTMIASNAGWSSSPTNASAVTAADSQVGAFAFPSGSADSALVGTFAPGSYTAQVTGVAGASGVALTEVYDMQVYSPFSSQKLVNVSTRGSVGTGSNVMIGGFNINGIAPKKLLIRGAGPALTALGVTGSLATPHLQLFDNSQALIRENYSWQTGNDPALVSVAVQATGAFSFANGSADSAILIVLPPGTYTAEVSGANSATGTALVEVYEIP